jgi:hypothetical protein
MSLPSGSPRFRRATSSGIRRALWAGSLAGSILASACTEETPPGAPPGSPTLRRMAEDLGTDVVEHLRRGYEEGRSPEIYIVPQPVERRHPLERGRLRHR